MSAPPVRPLLAVAALFVGALTGCAPATLGPMVMRLGPGNPEQRLWQVGVRTGPRLTASLAGENDFDDPFHGDANVFNTQQWGIAYDAAVTFPLTQRLSLHTGAQGEFFLPLPVPGYGLYAGASYYVGSERLGLAPALSLRGASDFGLRGAKGGPGSILGAEATCAFSVQPESGVSFGVVPFFGWNQVFVPGQNMSALYFGAVVAARVSVGGGVDHLELSGGFGRARTDNGTSWNVPIMGVRGGR